MSERCRRRYSLYDDHQLARETKGIRHTLHGTAIAATQLRVLFLPPCELVESAHHEHLITPVS